MALNIKILSAIAGGLLGLAFVFYVVSNAVPMWSKFELEGIKQTTGIWRYCLTIQNAKGCAALPCPAKNGIILNSCDKVLAARAFVTLACILSGIAALCLFGSMVINDNMKSRLLLVAKGLVFLCLVMGIIGVALGISTTIEGNGVDKPSIDAAAIIGIIALVINFAGGILAAIIK